MFFQKEKLFLKILCFVFMKFLNVNHSTAYARDHEPCIIFMDEIDAIGSKRLPEGQVNDREVQRTLMEVFYFLI